MENGRRALHGGHFHLQGRRGTNSFARKPSAVIGASPGKIGTGVPLFVVNTRPSVLEAY
jgi:hypothetical protein